MDQEQLLEMVKKRAAWNVEQKIGKFKKSIRALFKELTGTNLIEKNGYTEREANYKILERIIETESFGFDANWPAFLWREEEGRVLKDILSTMDTMQKALIAPEPKDTDCKPETEE